MIPQLKEHFHVTGKRVKRLQLLQFFQRAGQLGIYSTSSKPQITWFSLPRTSQLRKAFCQAPIKTRQSVTPATADTVKQFYASNEISRIMPGAKDYISVNSEGTKVHLQKQLILCNLKEAYLSSKEQNPEMSLDLSKFVVMDKKLYVGWSKWYTCHLCVYHPPECETYVRWCII
jgi:hypothetical protein